MKDYSHLRHINDLPKQLKLLAFKNRMMQFHHEYCEDTTDFLFFNDDKGNEIVYFGNDLNCPSRKLEWLFDFESSVEGFDFWKRVNTIDIDLLNTIEIPRFNAIDTPRFSAVQIINYVVDHYVVDPPRRRAFYKPNHITKVSVLWARGHRYSPIGLCSSAHERVEEVFNHSINFNLTPKQFENNIKHIYNESNFLDEIFKPHFVGYPIEFWLDLEQLHFHKHYWTPLKLSKRGEELVDELKLKWKNFDNTENYRNFIKAKHVEYAS
jgi:hypothetical protein